MARVKRAVNGKKSRRAVLEQASGYRGAKSRHFRKANEQVMRSGEYAFRDRRVRILDTHLDADEENPASATNQLRLDAPLLEQLDYVALGDWHGLKQVNARSWYSGTPERPWALSTAVILGSSRVQSPLR